MDTRLILGPGVVLALEDSDYLYGMGLLALRVVEIGADPNVYRQLEWVRIVGQEVLWDGTERPRDVMVRVAAIEKALRPATWRPPKYRRRS